MFWYQIQLKDQIKSSIELYQRSLRERYQTVAVYLENIIYTAWQGHEILKVLISILKVL